MRKGKCPKCGKIKLLTIHHKDGNNQNNLENNILLVCRLCHDKIHGMRPRIKYPRKYQPGTKKWKKKKNYK